MSSYEVHNVRFYKPKPYPVYCMALHEHKKLLGLGRSDASIELWNLNGAPFIEKRFSPSLDNNSVQQICWCKDRLFSVGLHGFLIEYDLYNLQVKTKSAVTGEAAFCLDANENELQLAVGTEQGYLNIFSVNEEILFEKFLDKQEGRILCLKYFSNGQYIASGSIDTIRIWNVENGQAIHRMSTGRSEANKPTIVWNLQVTTDSVIISGDSRGKITFWDGKLGSQIESFQSHRADVLAICLSEDKKTLYCAGADPTIICYEKVNVKGTTQKWVKSIQRKVHDHDVRCLLLNGDKLYSSGIDGYLACSYHPPKTLHKFPPLLPYSNACLCTDLRLILLRYSKHLELWELGKASEAEEDSTLLKLENTPRKVLELFRSVKDENGQNQREGIICSSVSNNGKWIMFSTNSAVRIFNFSHENKKPSLTPLDSLSKECSVCLQATFTRDSHYLIMACRFSNLKIVNLMDLSSRSIDTSSVLEDTITFLVTSSCSKYFIAADPQSNISVWINIKGSWEYYCKLPKYDSAPTAMSTNPHKPSLLIVYADQKVTEYNLKFQKISKYSKVLNMKLGKKALNSWYAVRNITFNPKSPYVIILHDDTNIIVANKKKSSLEPDVKVPRMENDSEGKKVKSKRTTIHTIKKYKHLVYLDWISEQELVAIEVKPLSLTEQLPPCLRQNLFGTK